MGDKHLPFVSLCTPTFNRRPFIPHIIKCVENQDYPVDRIEWIIVDDGTDPIGDMVKDIPCVKYHRYETKMSLGKKRNVMHDKCKGDILVYIDDDDYYPPCRVSHAVDTLMRNPGVLCVGSSEMYIYFKHIHKMYSFGPYAANHSTAATFAFRKELLQQTSYDEDACVAEEKKFLKNYTIPIKQLDPRKSILVFSHIHNSFDKKKLLTGDQKHTHREIDVKVEDIITDADALRFFMKDIDVILEEYRPGDPSVKTDVNMYIRIMEKTREDLAMSMNVKMQEAVRNMETEFNSQKRVYDTRIGFLTKENITLKDKLDHTNEKMRSVISECIELKKTMKMRSEFVNRNLS